MFHLSFKTFIEFDCLRDVQEMF